MNSRFAISDFPLGTRHGVESVRRDTGVWRWRPDHAGRGRREPHDSGPRIRRGDRAFWLGQIVPTLSSERIEAADARGRGARWRALWPAGRATVDAAAARAVRIRLPAAVLAELPDGAGKCAGSRARSRRSGP